MLQPRDEIATTLIAPSVGQQSIPLTECLQRQRDLIGFVGLGVLD